MDTNYQRYEKLTENWSWYKKLWYNLKLIGILYLVLMFFAFEAIEYIRKKNMERHFNVTQ
jgi:hypothetical protein